MNEHMLSEPEMRAVAEEEWLNEDKRLKRKTAHPLESRIDRLLGDMAIANERSSSNLD